jgi:hypothetical protein
MGTTAAIAAAVAIVGALIAAAFLPARARGEEEPASGCPNGRTRNRAVPIPIPS